MVKIQSDTSYVQIVYAKVKSNGKTELVPLKLYTESSLEHLQFTRSSSTHTGAEAMLLANRYELQRILGQGGFGRTYLTLDRYRFNEPCVVKEFLPQQRGTDEVQKSRELFEREAKILYQLDRVQIPKFFACFEENDRLFLVQEYIKGQTYSALLHERQQQCKNFTEVEIIELLKNLLPVLSYLHDREIVHRDISPDNIIRSEDCHLPVLIDFGIGRSAVVQSQSQGAAAKNSTPPTHPSIVGKLGYAPHEQIWLGQSFPSSDLYALAVTAVVLLTGLDPQTALCNGEWQSFTSVSPSLVLILNRMLEDVPIHRYQSAGAVLAELERLTATMQVQLGQRKSANSQMTTRIISPAVSHQPPPASFNANDSLIERCERELLNYIGPIAKFLVKTTIAKQPHLTSQELIDALAQHISQPDRAAEFRNRLRQ